MKLIPLLRFLIGLTFLVLLMLDRLTISLQIGTSGGAN